MTAITERLGLVQIESYAGRRAEPCTIVGETRTRYRVRFKKVVALPPYRLVMPGETVLVPRRAVSLVEGGGA
jgi:hypothetical protein